MTGGQEQAADDVGEIGWFAPEALPPPEQIAFQNGRDAIAALGDAEPEELDRRNVDKRGAVDKETADFARR